MRIARLPALPKATTRTAEQRSAAVENVAWRTPARDARTERRLADPETVAVTRTRSRALKYDPAIVSGAFLATRSDALRDDPEPAVNAERPRTSVTAIAVIPIRYVCMAPSMPASDGSRPYA